MPAKPIYDLEKIDVNNVIADQDAIYELNPHRYEFMLLDGILHLDEEGGIVVGYRDCDEEEFWVRGHIPGRPLFPGVLMIETAAQLVSYYALKVTGKNDAFLGFAGVTDVKFRGQVVPGDKLVMIGQMLDVRSRRCVGEVQGYVGDQQVFQGKITGMWL
jgi:3-hydroxyacyl-[acyl-carrier-protein] dehydratase